MIHTHRISQVANRYEVCRETQASCEHANLMHAAAISQDRNVMKRNHMKTR